MLLPESGTKLRCVGSQELDGFGLILKNDGFLVCVGIVGPAGRSVQIVARTQGYVADAQFSAEHEQVLTTG